MRDINYNKCVTESEVVDCHREQAGQKRITRKIFGLVSGWMQQPKSACKSIARPTASHGPKQFGKGYIYFWPKKNKNPPRCSILADGQHGGCTPITQGQVYPLEAGKFILPVIRVNCKEEIRT